MRSPKKSSLILSGTHTLAIACLAATTWSCTGADDPPAEDVTSTQSALFAPPTTSGVGLILWNGATPSNPTGLGNGVHIPVCFAVRPRVDATGAVFCPAQTSANVDCYGQSVDPNRGITLNAPFVRNKIRTAIERTWVRYANVDLFGWGDCPIDPGTGKHLEQQLPGRIMIQFDNGDQILNQMGYSATRPDVIRYNWPVIQDLPNANEPFAGTFNVIHEMGHALGFDHEWLRDDFTDPRCSHGGPDGGPAQGGIDTVSGGIRLSPFPDPDSIMNYCGFSRPDDGTISLGDIIGVQSAYGRKSKGALVGFGGMCANINGGLTATGTPIIAFPCTNQFNDLWFRDTTVQRFRADMGSGVERCMNVNGTVKPNAPTSVVSSTCNSNSSEAFPLSNVEWHGMGNLCATVSGTSVIMNTCNGSSAQKWTFMNGSTVAGAARFDQIVSASTGKCVTATTTTGAVGEQLSLVTCSSTNTKQRFSYPGQGVIGYGNFCMNVSGGVPTPGQVIGLWNGCTAVPRLYNETFTVVGNMTSQGQCLDATNHSQVSVAPCSSTNVDQIWEYYL
jgi:hypothetical protein